MWQRVVVQSENKKEVYRFLETIGQRWLGKFFRGGTLQRLENCRCDPLKTERGVVFQGLEQCERGGQLVVHKKIYILDDNTGVNRKGEHMNKGVNG